MQNYAKYVTLTNLFEWGPSKSPLKGDLQCSSGSSGSNDSRGALLFFQQECGEFLSHWHIDEFHREPSE